MFDVNDDINAPTSPQSGINPQSTQISLGIFPQYRGLLGLSYLWFRKLILQSTPNVSLTIRNSHTMNPYVFGHDTHCLMTELSCSTSKSKPIMKIFFFLHHQLIFTSSIDITRKCFAAGRKKWSSSFYVPLRFGSLP